MLVLTRRATQKIVFPQIDISLQVLDIRGKNVRVGVEAPHHIRVLRDEVAADVDPASLRQFPALSREVRHTLRNRSNAVNLAVQLLRYQIQRGAISEAEETLQQLAASLQEFDAEFIEPHPEEAEDRLRAAPRECRTLLVEDDTNERELLAGLLRMHGCAVETAGDGEDALDWLSSHARPDVVLLDMLMPRCSGPRTIERIRRDSAYAGLTVFAVSGTSPMELGVSVGPGGVDGWFRKPLDPEVLVKEMHTAVVRVQKSA